MSDDSTEKQKRPGAPSGAEQPGAGAAPDAVAPADDPDAALERLASMTGPGPAEPVPLPPAPAVSPFTAAPATSSRPTTSARKSALRPAGGPNAGRTVARVAAPAVFLIAVIALIGIVVQSGVTNGSTTPTPTPGIQATKTSSATKVKTKRYVIKSGDSMSSIAVHFGTSVAELQTLNPHLGDTLVVGARIVVPAQ
jgi:hypothetical protein